MRKVQVGVILAAGILLIATVVRSQAPVLGPVWEYSSVTGSPVTNVSTKTGSNEYTYDLSAKICYATATGCRNESVSTKVTNPNLGAEALMMAAAKLGEQGWELTTSTDIDNGRGFERVMLFRRLKQETNK